ncbi:MAG TPA: SIMPL domain-containing protein [Verrucomicrobiae bacterium]|nr:SIMPL domain-containing protein [Verrucomicrobiae bacterium]
MKLFATFIAGLMLIGTAFAQDKEAPPHVTVYGTATTEVVPDEMDWSVKIQTRGLNLSTVAQEHDKTVQNVLFLLKKSKLPDTNIQTAAMQFGENWEYRNNERLRNGYIATTYVTFKLHDFGQYKTLWFGFAEMPSVSVESVTFEHTKRIEYQNETRQKAIRAAKDKAFALAAAIGSEIGEPLFIEEEPTETIMPMNYFNNTRLAAADAVSEQGESVAPGTIPIKARVHASFRLLTSQK